MSGPLHCNFRSFADTNWGRDFKPGETPTVAEIHLGVTIRLLECVERIEARLKAGPPLEPQATQKLFADGVWEAYRRVAGDTGHPPGWHPTTWRAFYKRLKDIVGWRLADQWWSSGMTAMPSRDDVRRLLKGFPDLLGDLTQSQRRVLLNDSVAGALSHHGPDWLANSLEFFPGEK